MRLLKSNSNPRRPYLRKRRRGKNPEWINCILSCCVRLSRELLRRWSRWKCTSAAPACYILVLMAWHRRPTKTQGDPEQQRSFSLNKTLIDVIYVFMNINACMCVYILTLKSTWWMLIYEVSVWGHLYKAEKHVRRTFTYCYCCYVCATTAFWF